MSFHIANLGVSWYSFVRLDDRRRGATNVSLHIGIEFVGTKELYQEGLAAELRKGLPVGIADQVVFNDAEGHASQLKVTRGEGVGYAKVITSVDVPFGVAFELARICTSHLAVELWLPNGKMLYYEQSELVPDVRWSTGPDIITLEAHHGDYLVARTAVMTAALALMSDVNIRPVINGKTYATIERGSATPQLLP